MKRARRYIHLTALLPAAGLYAWLGYRFSYHQDDAYITYRYVANFLSGHGLVFNYGEYVEGITNHGWAIILAAAGALGIDYLMLARVLGWLSGLGLIVVTYYLTRAALPEMKWYWTALPTVAVAANPSLAYWAGAGLETSAFALLTAVILLLWLLRHRTLGAALAVAVWLRPEGALLAGLLIVIDWIRGRRFPKYIIGHTALAFIASLPFVTFKLVYYGDLLPNSFFAKAGFQFSQLVHGAAYAWRFVRDYPLLALSLPAAAVLFTRLSVRLQKLLLFGAIFAAYIILVGGDVLEVHRFFLPLAPIFALLLTYLLWLMLSRTRKTNNIVGVAVCAVVIAATGIRIPFDYVDAYYTAGLGLNRKMDFLAKNLKASDNSDFSIAASTIGVLGFGLQGHDVIDVVGLTDTVISRHPQDPIPGMTTGWREPNYNAEYVLKRAPNYILFSTGAKPTAPGEKALMLYGQFVNAYRIVTWEYRGDGNSNSVMTGAFKRLRPVKGPFQPTYPLEYVDDYVQGINYMLANQLDRAIHSFEASLKASPRPYFPYVIHRCALAYGMKHDYAKAQRLLHALLVQDSFVLEAHGDLYKYAVVSGDSAAAALHRRWIERLAPWQEKTLIRFDSVVAAGKP